MKKLKSTLTNMILVLVSVALFTGGLLAFVNHMTEGPIQKQAEKALADGIQSVMSCEGLQVTANDTVKQQFDNKESMFIIHKVIDKNGKNLGAAVESMTQGFGGDLNVLVGFDTDGNVLGYTILQTNETPGLGAKADKWFQKDGKGNIIGKHPAKNKLAVTKGGEGEIDAITASTITSRAFLKAVNQAYSAYQNDKDAHNSASKQPKRKEE